MPEKSDLELINKLFESYEQMMFKNAMCILHNKTDAEDAVQEAFLWIINNLDEISQIPCNKTGSYFATVIEHRSIDIYRKRVRHPTEDIEERQDLSTGESVEETALSNITVEEIRAAMNELSKRDRDILYLFLIEEHSPKDIAKLMRISKRNINTYIARARGRLIDVLRKRGIADDF